MSSIKVTLTPWEQTVLLHTLEGMKEILRTDCPSDPGIKVLYSIKRKFKKAIEKPRRIHVKKTEQETETVKA